MYSPEIGSGALLVAVGPYIGYGTGGTWTTKEDVVIGDIAIVGKGNISFQNDKSYAADLNTHVYAKPWDYGVHFRLGYSLFSRYPLMLELQQGMANMQPKWGDYKPKNTIRNRSFGVSLAYQL